MYVTEKHTNMQHEKIYQCLCWLCQQKITHHIPYPKNKFSLLRTVKQTCSYTYQMPVDFKKC